jgi:hypothetical protein
MNMQQAMSFLRQAFPDFEDHSGDPSPLCANTLHSTVDVFDFASFAALALEKRDDRRLLTLFNLLETFLAQGSSELHDWVVDAIEALQGVCAWRRQGECTFTGLLGRETRVLWDRLEFLRRVSSELDLSDCSVFEAEILTWRFVREKSRSLTAAA